VDRRRFDADPDPTFHLDAHPDQDLASDPDPNADPTSSYKQVGKSKKIFDSFRL
jgi:hypothetical protein